MTAKMTIKEVKAWLESADGSEPLIDELRGDGRAGVQKLLVSHARKREKQLEVRRKHEEKELFDEGFRSFPGTAVAGVDEAGRGPLAGPVVTAAVILASNCPELEGLDDSKAMSRSERERLAAEIRNCAISYSIHIQPAEKIDRLNIYRATKQSMEQAVLGLPVAPDAIIADAMQLDTGIPCHNVVKADAQSLCVAAASVLAKTERDAYMDRLHESYPAYGFERNAGYGTPDHLKALEQYGPCPEHRRSFSPVSTFLVGTSEK